MDPSALLAFGAVKQDLAGVDGAFGLDYAAGLALSAGFDVLGNDVCAFYDALAFLGGNAEHFADVRFFTVGIGAAYDDDGVAGLYMPVSLRGL